MIPEYIPRKPKSRTQFQDVVVNVRHSFLDFFQDNTIDQLVGSIASNGSILLLPSTSNQTLSTEERRNFLRCQISQDPALFLERYGAHLSIEVLTLLKRFTGDYEICFHITQILKKYEISRQSSDMSGDALKSYALLPSEVKNRRFARMEQLEAKGFFGEQAIAVRLPELYDQFMLEPGVDVRVNPGIDVNSGRQPEEDENLMERLREVHKFAESSDPGHSPWYKQQSKSSNTETSKPTEPIILSKSCDTISQSADISKFCDLESSDSMKQSEVVDVKEMDMDMTVSPAERNGMDTSRSDSSSNPAVPKSSKSGPGSLGRWGDFSQGLKEVSSSERTQKMSSGTVTQNERGIDFVELQSAAREYFLEGKDKSVNYFEIDNDGSLDDLNQIDRDAEDAYFSE
eukprot:821409_1